MAYDSTDGYVVLFGGEHRNTTTFAYRYLNDSWEFVGGKWTNLTIAHAPSPRFGFMMADDPADHAVVLFGGNGPHASYYNDTWEYAGGTWTNVSGAGPPPGRFWGSMSYDTALGKVLLFGGNSGGALSQEYSNTTWEFHAGTWTNISATHSPPGRDDQAQVDDTADGTVVMFGGLAESGYLNDTWTYASGLWSNVTTSKGPDVRAGPGLAYDAAAGKVVLYGGYPSPGYNYATWVYSAGAWSHFNTSAYPPSGTQWGQMTYDAADQVVVVFEGDGNDNATWTLNFSSGPPAPLTVTIRASPSPATVNQSVAFSASISGGVPPYSLHWRFGDATAAIIQNTSHAYAQAGTYSVFLYVNDSNGTPAVRELNETVQGASAPSASPPTWEYLALGGAAAAVGILVGLIVWRRRRHPPEAAAVAPASPTPSEGRPPPSA